MSEPSTCTHEAKQTGICATTWLVGSTAGTELLKLQAGDECTMCLVCGSLVDYKKAVVVNEPYLLARLTRLLRAQNCPDEIEIVASAGGFLPREKGGYRTHKAVNCAYTSLAVMEEAFLADAGRRRTYIETELVKLAKEKSELDAILNHRV
jgi:hypothetical protein